MAARCRQKPLIRRRRRLELKDVFSLGQRRSLCHRYSHGAQSALQGRLSSVALPSQRSRSPSRGRETAGHRQCSSSTSLHDDRFSLSRSLSSNDSQTFSTALDSSLRQSDLVDSSHGLGDHFSRSSLDVVRPDRGRGGFSLLSSRLSLLRSRCSAGTSLRTVLPSRLGDAELSNQHLHRDVRLDRWLHSASLADLLAQRLGLVLLRTGLCLLFSLDHFELFDLFPHAFAGRASSNVSRHRSARLSSSSDLAVRGRETLSRDLDLLQTGHLDEDSHRRRTLRDVLVQSPLLQRARDLRRHQQSRFSPASAGLLHAGGKCLHLLPTDIDPNESLGRETNGRTTDGDPQRSELLQLSSSFRGHSLAVGADLRHSLR